ncbi:hypothetical protein CWB73_09995 [Pseudoalteromonas phenolica]|uniref:Uncharacterized protein n=1 Tax=Pseudoalteromonas phenolica TaxID=161398 RepID=A0A5S3YTH2_9GAMM|nr:hypothetical protein CWB72_15000 [Pseudoalteromonas phenolica]TMP80739.1 hypothetical protein CWB73_09995 [Pseudoalteromonas phenolica]
MSFSYLGNNNAVGSLSLAINMQQAKVRVVVGRVNDESTIENLNAPPQSGQQVSELLRKQTKLIQQFC